MVSEVQQAVQEAVEATTPEVVETADVLNEEDVPLEHMGVDLSDLPADKRKAVIDTFAQKESYIGKLQQRIAERKAEPELAEPVAQIPEPYVPEPSDEEILKAFGYAPDGAYYEIAKEVVLPMAKQVLAQASEMSQMKQHLQVEAAWDGWNASLDKLEDQYGELPVGREAVVEFAVQQGIDNPEVAYYRLAMQAQKMTAEAAQEQRLRKVTETTGMKRQVGAQVRPGGNPPTVHAPFEPTGNLAADIKSAAAEAEKELGLSWDGAAATFLGR